MKLIRQKKGFTLIEILVVISIIGLLAAIIMPRFVSQGEKAKMAEAANIMGTIARAMDTERFKDGDPSLWLDMSILSHRFALGFTQNPSSTAQSPKSWVYTSSVQGRITATRQNVNNPPTTPAPSCVGSEIRLEVDTATYSGTGCYAADQRYDAARTLKP